MKTYILSEKDILECERYAHSMGEGLSDNTIYLNHLSGKLSEVATCMFLQEMRYDQVSGLDFKAYSKSQKEFLQRFGITFDVDLFYKEKFPIHCKTRWVDTLEDKLFSETVFHTIKKEDPIIARPSGIVIFSTIERKTNKLGLTSSAKVKITAGFPAHECKDIIAKDIGDAVQLHIEVGYFRLSALNTIKELNL